MSARPQQFFKRPWRNRSKPKKGTLLVLSTSAVAGLLFASVALAIGSPSTASGARNQAASVSVRELVTALSPVQKTDSTWFRGLISLGIDAGNDLGIVVPDTQFNVSRGIVYRCYRLGETAFLADRPLVSTLQDEPTRTDDAHFSVTSIVCI